MDHGVDYIIRETYGSSLELAEAVLTTLGDAPGTARAAVKKFRQHDERTLGEQYAIKEDEVKFLASARESAQQLEKLFDSDSAKSD
jgi:O-acetyl-ADP-ribose deacetylase (regulator of RNase III)